MRHRIFVAINLDERTIAEIGELVDGCRKKLPYGIEKQIRFMPPENWHITLSFLGYQNEDDIGKIKMALSKTAANLEPFEILFEGLVWGPAGNTPRMIWLLGEEETSKQLGEIKNRFENLLEEVRVPFKREFRKFNAHITLARFDIRLPRPLPDIERKIDLRFKAESLDLMESKLERGGAQYTLLEAFHFKKGF